MPAGRGAQRLRDGWARAAAGVPAPAGLGDGRLLRLAAALAGDAVLSGSNELYHRDLPVTDALALALKGAGGTQAVTAHEIRDRVRARFPALPPLPDRPRLDQLIADAGLGLVYDDAEHGYRWPTRAADTKGLASRQATITASAGPQLVTGGRSGHRLAESAATRSFLALGVDADRTDRAVEALTGRFGAAVVDVTQVLIDAMRAQAAEVGLPWDLVQAADAAPAGSRDAAGLAALVQRSLPAVEAAITAALVRRARRDQAGRAHRDRAARPVRPPGHAEPVDRPGRAPAAGHLGDRPAATGQPGRHRRQAPAAARRPRAVLPPGRRVDRRPSRRHRRRRNTMTATAALTADLQRQVLLLEDDLRDRVAADPELEGHWKQEHQRALDKERTAASWVAWRDDRVTQAAVAWVLTSVFIRFCEDNALVGPVWIAGPEHRRQEALDAQLAFFRTHPEDTDREWLQAAIDHLAALPATKALVDSHSALHLRRTVR